MSYDGWVMSEGYNANAGFYLTHEQFNKIGQSVIAETKGKGKIKVKESI